MFKAIRSQFGRWRDLSVPKPTRLRIWRYSGLFMFEFAVVLLGVLAAQMLQESGAKARAGSDARVTVERAAREVANFRATSEYWLDAGPCIERRMDQLMRAAATGTDNPDVHGPRPRMPLSDFTPWSEPTVIAARQVYGEGLVSDYGALQTMAAKMADDSHELAGDWALLGLVDPTLGPVAREDRLNARVAAGRIKGRLASLQVTAAHAVAAAERLAISADPRRARLLTLPAGCRRIAGAS